MTTQSNNDGSEVKRPNDGRETTAEEGPMAPGHLLLLLLSLYKMTNREQIEEKEEEKETQAEQNTEVKTESSSGDSEDKGTKDVKEDDERLSKTFLGDHWKSL